MLRPVTTWIDDLAALQVGVLDQLHSAVIAAVGDPDFGRPHAHSCAAVFQAQPERAEIRGRPARPDKIADPPELALQAMGDALRDLGRDAHRRRIEEIIAVDAAEIDLARIAIGDDVDRPVEVEGTPIVRAKLFAVPSGRKANTTFVPDEEGPPLTKATRRRRRR